MKHFTSLINGTDLDSSTYDYFPYADKYVLELKKTREIIKEVKNGKIPNEINEYIYGRYCINQKDQYEKAIKSAYKAFEEFKKTPLRARRKIFNDMYNLLMEKKEHFISILIVEGHPKKLAEWEFEGMRIGSSPETIDFYFSQIRKEVGRYGSEIVYWSRKPDGVVCLNPPGNASASNSYNGILSFIPGNTVIVKPPLRTPISTIFLWNEIIWEALKRNGAPLGTVNIIIGNAQKILDSWLKSPLINDVVYFGNSKKGLNVGSKIYAAGKKPILELSGNDLFLVWKDADIDGASESLVDSFLGSTQICMVPKIAIIHQDIYDKFVSVFTKKVKALKFGLPSDSNTIFSPVGKIKEYFEFLNDALDKGAKLICGGKQVNYAGEESKKGLYVQPTLLEVNDTSQFGDMKCFREEIFFPLLPLVKISGKDEQVFTKMIKIVSKHEYGLRTSLWASSYKYLRKFAKNLENTGLLRINIRHIGFSHYLSTHGGTKRSGGPFGEMSYFWQKTSHLQGVTRIAK